MGQGGNFHSNRAANSQAGPVLFVNASAHRGGAQRSLELLIYGLNAAGLRLATVGPAAGLCARTLHGRVAVHYPMPAFEPIRRPGLLQTVRLTARWLSCSLAVTQAIVNFKPRIIHANSTNAMLTAMIPAKCSGRPLIWHVRDLTPLGPLNRLCGRFASAVIAISHAVHRHLLEEGIPAAKIKVIHNGVEAGFADLPDRAGARNPIREKLNLPPDAFVYLNVGQFVGWKRQDVFLRAAAQVLRLRPDSRFLIVGDDGRADHADVRSRLTCLVAELGLSERLTILDWQDDMVGLLLAADVMVHAAESEPFGRVLIEAMKAGLPVVAVKSGGPAEIIEDGRSGLLADAAEPNALAALMIRLREDSSLRKSLIEQGLARAAGLFSAEQTTQQVHALYQETSDLLENLT